MLPLLAGSSIRIRHVRLDGATVVLAANGIADSVHCPDCTALATQVHDRYPRRPLDWSYPVLVDSSVLAIEDTSLPG
jgi:hypothetical protein